MQTSNNWALKEWAVICRALAAGRQCLLLRKGGIAEPDGVFRVEHPEFWLLETHFHEDAGQLSSAAGPFLTDRRDARAHAPARAGDAPSPGGDAPVAGVERLPPGAGLAIASYAVATKVWRILDQRRLPRLAPFHVWSEETVLRRFHYREPGLFGVSLRVYNRQETVSIADTPEIAGCRSWVELPRALATDSLTPALGDDAYSRASREIAAAME